MPGFDIMTHNDNKNPLVGIGIGVVTACVMGLTALDADATRIEYYATVGEPFCEYNYVHYTARFADGIVFDSSYKRLDLSPCALVIKGLDQGILGGEGVPPMRISGKCKLQIPLHLAYGPEPAVCFSGDCNIPGNATLLYDINFIEVYSGNRSK
ncbi:Peptidyl-prolyl cis-trans isomerase FKBP16-2, chloroplastic [Glycine soja]|nr:Peptidyl-prolyl cis-trans isomerase FKBP16-2, chloroplastic [Glycine soja]